MYYCGLLFFLLDLSFDLVTGISQTDINRHLELGREFLSKGHLQDALSQYHAAVEGDSQNFLTYYKRGTVYLALSKARFALLDFDKVIELKPDFVAARINRGSILLKQGEFDDASLEFRKVLSAEPHHTDVEKYLYDVEEARQSFDTAKEYYQMGDYRMAIAHLNHVIDICPWSPKIRELRADCHAALGDHVSAISDIRTITKLLSDNTEGFYKLASMLYRLGQVDESLREIRECLKLDPEHKTCFPFYKKIKKISKHLTDAEAHEQTRDFTNCVSSANRALKLEPDAENVRFLAFHLLCKCYAGDNEASEAIARCQDALNIRKEVEVLCDSAEAYLLGELYDDAIRDYKQALEIEPHNQRAKQGLQKAQQRQKMSETRDYYKILGVPRTASKREITKAYRKAAQKWHPDNFPETEEKKRAEKKFIDIAAAKEVLTDDQKRARFDQGEDPLDPESGKHQGFNPFQEFHHFHGTPFQFKFHFN